MFRKKIYRRKKFAENNSKNEKKNYVVRKFEFSCVSIIVQWLVFAFSIHFRIKVPCTNGNDN